MEGNEQWTYQGLYNVMPRPWFSTFQLLQYRNKEVRRYWTKDKSLSKAQSDTWEVSSSWEELIPDLEWALHPLLAVIHGLRLRGSDSLLLLHPDSLQTLPVRAGRHCLLRDHVICERQTPKATEHDTLWVLDLPGTSAGWRKSSKKLFLLPDFSFSSDPSVGNLDKGSLSSPSSNSLQ